MAYSFDFIDHDGDIDHFDIGYHLSDGEALWQAQLALRANCSVTGVNVWRGGERIGAISRAAVAEFVRNCSFR